MSTLVSDLVLEIQDRLSDQQLKNLFPTLNRAIRIVENRLYIMDSDLVIGDLDVGVFKYLEYTSDTIAFVDGGIDAVDTITDSADQFVVTGFERGIPIETDCEGNEGPFHVAATVSAGTLTLHAEDSVVEQAAGQEYILTSIDEFGYLPDDFNGLIEKPYIEGITWELEPLSSQAAKIAYTSASLPRWYKIRGNRLYVYPRTNADIVIKGDYYKKSPAITKMNQYIPFYTVMDAAIQEYLVRALAVSPAAADDLQGFLHSEVDLIAQKRSRKTPVGFPGGVNWGF